VAERQPLKPAYLITGNDLPKVALALRRLRARFAEGSVEAFSAETTTGADAVAATNALGLFGGGERLVIVEAIERWKKADAQAVIAALEQPTPGSVLALVGEPARLEGLVDAVAAVGDVVRLGVPTRRQRNRDVDDFAAWVQAKFHSHGIDADRELAQLLVAIVGEHTLALDQEIAKLATWADGHGLRAADVERLATPGEDEVPFALVDGWGGRDVAGVLTECESQLRLGKEPFLIASRLGDYVRKARAIKVLRDEEVAIPEIARRLEMKEYPARKQAEQAQAFAIDELEAAVVRIAALDLALKGGSRIDPTLELERALVDVTRATEHV
jgi:DNA polymerase III delta subunit